MVDTIDITKGTKVNIQKIAPSIKIARTGLAWDASKKAGQQFDMDVSVICCGEDNNALITSDGFIFYHHPANGNKSIYITGDNRTGDKEGYDEEAFIDFDKVPAEVKYIYICVSISMFKTRKQNFGQINNAYCDVYNNDTRERLVHFDLTEDMSSGTGCICARFMREADGSWSFKAVGDIIEGGLKGVLGQYGLETIGDE